MTTPTVRIRIDFGPGRALGPGKVDLLECIAETGSLAQAATALEMSYRRAWALLQDLNTLFQTPVVTLTKGGRGGGGAVVTPLGRTVIAAFRDVEAEAAKAAAGRFRRLRARNAGKGRRVGVRRLASA